MVFIATDKKVTSGNRDRNFAATEPVPPPNLASEPTSSSRMTTCQAHLGCSQAFICSRDDGTWTSQTMDNQDDDVAQQALSVTAQVIFDHPFAIVNV
ncbi:MAG: hypothetical protein HKN47_26625 [Pirellulaceae bacterium]|nr:hypothetical protein [Pirellulaceae bacterium]